MRPVNRQRQHPFRAVLAAVGVVATLSASAPAQEAAWLRLSGGIGLSSDLVSRSLAADTAFPSVIHRASLNVTLTLFDQVHLPFEAYVTTLGSGYSQPFNQFGIHPRIGDWLTLHGGYFTHRLSDLTFGDVRLLGGGVDIDPGQTKISAIYGSALQARQPNAATGFGGDYERRILGGSVGYDLDGNTLKLNMMYAVDDRNSIVPDANTRPPAENLVSSLSFSLAPAPSLSVQGEVGLAMYTADVRASLVDSTDRRAEIERLITYNISSTLDAAGRCYATYAINQDVSLRGGISWTGPGYVTLGYMQLLNDMLDITLSPSLRMFGGDLAISGSIGQRRNNLRSTRRETTTQLLGSLNATMRFTETISADVAYANFGLRNDARNDTLRVSNISQYISVSPRWSFTAFSLPNTLSASFFLQNSEDINQYSPVPLVNENRSIGITHMLSTSTGWSFITAVNNYHGISAGTTTDVITACETVSTTLMEGRCSISLSGGLNSVQSVAASSQLFGRGSASYNLGDIGTLMVVIVGNSFDYAASGALAYTELTGSLQYSCSF